MNYDPDKYINKENVAKKRNLKWDFTNVAQIFGRMIWRDCKERETLKKDQTVKEGRETGHKKLRQKMGQHITQRTDDTWANIQESRRRVYAEVACDVPQ